MEGGISKGASAGFHFFLLLGHSSAVLLLVGVSLESVIIHVNAGSKRTSTEAMPSNRQQNSAETKILPDSSEAWNLIRCCFDIRDKDLNGISRKTLQRFAKRQKISAELSQKVKDALRTFLWDERLPITEDNASPVNNLIREIVTRLLAGYLALEQRLDSLSVEQDEALLLVIEELLVPTMAEAVAGNLINFEDAVWQRPCMIGDEFRGDRFWYLPAMAEGERLSPLQRTLQYWLRAGGFNVGYGFGRHINKEFPDNPKKQMERWLNGSAKPRLTDLYTCVEKAGEVDWLGGTADWKARFTLAWAVQTAGEELDRVFGNQIQKPALHFAEVYRKSARYALRYESYGPVSFVARLVENALRQSGAIQNSPFVRKLRQHLSGSWRSPAPLEEVLESLAVRHWLLSQAREEGVLSQECISPLFPDPSEQPSMQAQWVYDLTLPLKEAMRRETFDAFCDFAISIGVKLIKRRLAGLKGASGQAHSPPSVNRR